MSNSVHFHYAICGNPVLQARIERLLPRIQESVQYIHSRIYETGDLVNIGVIKLLEKGAQIPDFDQQTDAYWINAAVWAAKHAVESTFTYLKHISEAGEILTDDGDCVEMIDAFYDSIDCEDPEEALIEKEQIAEITRAMRLLSPENLTLIQMLVQGHTQQEIARKLGLSKTTISQRKQAIIKVLTKEHVPAWY